VYLYRYTKPVQVTLPPYKSGLEALAVYVRGARRNALVVVMYRPGSAAATGEFFDDFADVLERVSTYACPFILLGDVNLHLDIVDNPHTVKWQSVLDSYGLVQHVTSSTHREGHTLDVVVTRSDCPVTDVRVESPTISDHSFITTTVDFQFNHGHSAGIIRRRSWRNFDCDKFSDDLCQSELLRNPPTDAASLIDCYNNTLQNLLDSHAPFIDVKPRAHANAPWYDRQCQQAKAATRRLERAYRRDGTDSSREAWRDQSAVLRQTLRRRYVEYWSETITANVGDSKALWSKINVLLKTPQSATVGTHTADDFANFFQSKINGIRLTTANSQPPTITDRSCCQLSAFDEVTTEEMLQIVTKAPSKHCCLDPIPTWLVKRLLPMLAETLAKICNASFREGVFPTTLKDAVVRPRLKKSTLNPDDVSSYRPISNLSFLSKVVERAAANRLKAHFESQHLLPCRQSAYRAHHSTETAIIAVHDEIIKAVDNGDVCALVLLDLSAAFDTVDHQTLLRVLSCRFGVTDRALNWCSSYLSQRTQTFHVGALESGPHTVDCSVPQGSVLGPLKFISYTEDSADLITSYRLGYHLYADDIQLIGSTSISNVPSTVDRLEQCVTAIGDWCASRRLQLNPSKTEFIWFGTRVSLKKSAANDLSLRVGSDVITPVNAVRNLGVTFDSELTMQRHVNKVASVCFHHIRRLKQIRRLLGPDLTAALFSAFVLSRLDYCNAILAGLPRSTIAPLQRAQNAAARVIARLSPRDHVTSTLRELHWLPVPYRITYKLCLLMHLIHTGQAPSYLTDIVTQTATVSSRSRLRSASSLRYEQPRTRLKLGQRAFSYAAPAAWNTLPTSLQQISDTETFKRHLKTFLFCQAF